VYSSINTEKPLTSGTRKLKHQFPTMHLIPINEKNWIQFQESCYFFYNLNSPWKTWDQSRQLCQSSKSDLVVISSLEEQVCHKMLN
uniref:C-type lectin domain-containing protein n=1 Tax=Oryzias latipes TaxID=8090 RepID=A0A3P9IF21_ORYLA